MELINHAVTNEFSDLYLCRRAVSVEEDYKRLEVLAFEMEATIASLEEQLSIAHGDKDVATLRSESLASDLKELSDELNDTKSKLSTLKEEVSALSTTLNESELQRQKVESSLTSLIEEKEELSMVLKMNSAVLQIPIAFVWIPGFYPFILVTATC
ncbi:kinesin KIN-7O [Olea europaea subsp. europaea]|uniref:Kinesin KIN-7O n=1 Tax=Olea europaea subsp. europaea TaxID=158383 RepID=A0A8S0R1X5_OLEEU|nr:kinesin KIN-7O [Olea europaea subsp. europaea]